MTGPLTPEQRSFRARLAANSRWAREDGKEGTRAARAAGPASPEYWERKVDPDNLLNPRERQRRADNARSAHFARLALASAQARARRKGAA